MKNSSHQIQNGDPNFDKLFENLIKNDLDIFKNDALKYYLNEMKKLDQIENEEYLIPKIYQIKKDSIEEGEYEHTPFIIN